MDTLRAAGFEVPVLGFGTWKLTGDECRRAVCDALSMGYRHVDTAQAYGNEAEVGAGITDSGIDLGELVLVTKVADENRHPDRVRPSVESSLEALGRPQVDLLLLHRPGDMETTLDTLEAMHALRGDLIGAVGVSNFSPQELALALTTGPIVTNQIRRHVYNQGDQQSVSADSDLGEVILTAYSPLAHGRAADDPVLSDIGTRYDKTASQVALRWLLDRARTVAIPKAARVEHMSENMRIFDFQLDDEDRVRIGELNTSR